MADVPDYVYEVGQEVVYARHWVARVTGRYMRSAPGSNARIQVQYYDITIVSELGTAAPGGPEYTPDLRSGDTIADVTLDQLRTYE